MKNIELEAKNEQRQQWNMKWILGQVTFLAYAQEFSGCDQFFRRARPFDDESNMNERKKRSHC